MSPGMQLAESFAGVYRGGQTIVDEDIGRKFAQDMMGGQKAKHMS